MAWRCYMVAYVRVNIGSGNALLPRGTNYSTLMVFCPCRVGGAVWNHTAWLFPLMPLPTLSLFYSYFLFGNEYRKTSLEEILGNFNFVSIYYHWNWFEDLHHVQGIEIKDDSEMLKSQYLRENNGTPCHHGHPADCQLALTNVVEVQTKVVTND